MAQFEREDWKLFRNIDSLSQKAGVTKDHIPHLIVKELVDNALDAADDVECTFDEESNAVYVVDNGGGMTEEQIALYFSINRPLVSSKLLRLPSRGALGNGLRVVTGAVIALGAQMNVVSKGRACSLTHLPNGTTKVEARDTTTKGTIVEIIFRKETKINKDILAWGRNAITFNQGKHYEGKTSAYWYTSESLFDLVNAFKGSLADLLFNFHGIDKGTSKILAEYFKSISPQEMTFEQCDTLMGLLRKYSQPVKPASIGYIGEIESITADYKRATGVYSSLSYKGSYNAEIPYTIEIWALQAEEKSSLQVSVNRTPITGVVKAYSLKNEVTFNGCGLYINLKGKPVNMHMNVITPYMPITSDGKEPDFTRMRDLFYKLAPKVMTKAEKTHKKATVPDIKERDIIRWNMDKAIAKASGDGKFLFSQRQLYYAIRPFVGGILNGKQLRYAYFCSIITEYENIYGEIKGMFRDNRGSLYHPHLGQEIPIGTISVNKYRRPSWTFNKILYSEKEGLFQSLRQTGFPERHDIALLSSKGHASRAVKDLFDLLGDTSEEILFFVIHDADASGSKIYEALQQETVSRPSRRVKIINLGLEPWEAVDMGLEFEQIETKKRHPVARYIKDRWRDGVDWDEWLQGHRVELDAMDTPLFLEWIEEKIKPYSQKVVPPTRVLEDRLKAEVRIKAKEIVLNRLMKESKYDDLVDEEINKLSPEVQSMILSLRTKVEMELEANKENHWSDPIKAFAGDIAGG